jgi:ribosome-associated protein
MREITIPLREGFIELNKLLKLADCADSSGRGKQLVEEGLVTVDGQPESRKRAKIREGQIVECMETRISVTAPEKND